MKDSERLQKIAHDITQQADKMGVRPDLQIGAAIATALYEIAGQLALKNEGDR